MRKLEKPLWSTITHVYRCMCIQVCVCVCVEGERDGEREREREIDPQWKDFKIMLLQHKIQTVVF